MPSNAPVQVKDVENNEIQELYKLFLLEKAPALIGPDHKAIPIPASVYDVLVQVLGYMSQGKGVSVVPIMEELTTQHAANMLGVSRPFLIGLLNNADISFHKAGTHRRIYLKDLLAYRDKRDRERNQLLSEMAADALSAGDYDQLHTPD